MTKAVISTVTQSVQHLSSGKGEYAFSVSDAASRHHAVASIRRHCQLAQATSYIIAPTVKAIEQ